MKEEKKESKLPSPMAILSGKATPKKGEKSDKKPKPKYKSTMLTHHDDGTQTVSMDPAVSFSRPSLEEALAAIKEQHNAPAPEDPAPSAV